MKKIFVVVFIYLGLCACATSPKETRQPAQEHVYEYGFSIKEKPQSTEYQAALTDKVVYISQCQGISGCKDIPEHQYEIPYEQFMARLKVALRKEKEKNIVIRQQEYLEKGLADLKFEMTLLEQQKRNFAKNYQGDAEDLQQYELNLKQQQEKIAKYQKDLKYIKNLKSYQLNLDNSVDHLMKWVEDGKCFNYSQENQQDHFWRLLQKIGNQFVTHQAG